MRRGPMPAVATRNMQHAQRKRREREAMGENNGWFKIGSQPKDQEMFMAYAPPDERFPEGRQIIVRGDILSNMMASTTPAHLQFPATYWRPMLSPPSGD